MTVLIAGVGYIGAPLALAYLARGERVVGLENYFCTSVQSLGRLRRHANFQLVRGSIASTRTLERTFTHGPFRVIHLLAAQPSASPTAASTAYTEKTNLIGARMLLDAAARQAPSRIIFGSSFHVYGTPLQGAVDEQRPFGAFSDFSHLSKVYVEKLLEMYTRIHSLAAASVRLGIVYGLGPVMKTHPLFQTVPNRFAFQAARGEPLRVNPEAAYAIGFIHLDDAVTALLAAEELSGSYSTANAVCEALSVSQVALAVREAGGERGLSVAITPPASTPRAEAFTVTSQLARAGWQPVHRLRDRIGEVIDYARSPEEAP